MTSQQFAEAFKLAANGDELTGDVSIFNGYGLQEFTPIVATKADLALLIRWQALQFNGQWDNQELTSIKHCLRRKLTLVG